MSSASACVPGGADLGSRTPDSTCQPSVASVRATSRPMPRLAPVISAVRAFIALACLVYRRRNAWTARRSSIARYRGCYLSVRNTHASSRSIARTATLSYSGISVTLIPTGTSNLYIEGGRRGNSRSCRCLSSNQYGQTNIKPARRCYGDGDESTTAFPNLCDAERAR